MTRILLALFVLLGVCQVASGQLMSPEREANVRKLLPRVEDADVQAVLDDPGLLWYTEGEMPGRFQFFVDIPTNGQLVPTRENIGTAVRDPSGIAFGHGNKEFPWAAPAGTHRAKNFEAYRFLYLPKSSNGVRWPVVVWTMNAGDSLPNYFWTFPDGAVLGEVLATTDPATGYDYAFELRVRKRGVKLAADWETDVFRMFKGPTELAAAIKEARPEWSDDPQLQAAVMQLLAPKTMTVGRLRPSPRAMNRNIPFDESAGIDNLPELPADLVVDLFRQNRTFQSVLHVPWRTDDNGTVAHAPSNPHGFNIVPTDYDGTFIPVTFQSCNRCHQDSGQLVAKFARNSTGGGPREWYGRIRGSDRVLSFHPFDLNDRSYPFELRRELVEAGVVAFHDPQKHPKDIYRFAFGSDVRRTGPPDQGRVVQ